MFCLLTLKVEVEMPQKEGKGTNFSAQFPVARAWVPKITAGHMADSGGNIKNYQ